MSLPLAGRIALITGGGGEIGAVIAQRFAREGARICVGDINADAAQSCADIIKNAGDEAIHFAFDISDARGCQDIIAYPTQHFGGLTTLVNVAAAMTPDATLEDMPLEHWQRALDVNLTGSFIICKYAIAPMRASGGGSIINIASQLGQIGVPLRAPYSTSKAALIRLTTCIACDHAKDNIRANTLSPGAIDTARSLRRWGTREIANAKRGPSYLLGRKVRVDEIASGALFLASDEPSFMTGADLLIDGGFLAFKSAKS